ncbi:hypothetical protein H4R18_003499 [Coemansia javaensis]|uniref:AAA+ ATPase domain-containing protein n=1 Tax=Coemansia javaensis TaxID=2761396 RepID=A0A9W8LG83_9FUNG|nr:hypothetical protein H4R18_003499 [Coemansia javaensis]
MSARDTENYYRTVGNSLAQGPMRLRFDSSVDQLFGRLGSEWTDAWAATQPGGELHQAVTRAAQTYAGTAAYWRALGPTEAPYQEAAAALFGAVERALYPPGQDPAGARVYWTDTRGTRMDNLRMPDGVLSFVSGKPQAWCGVMVVVEIQGSDVATSPVLQGQMADAHLQALSRQPRRWILGVTVVDEGIIVLVVRCNAGTFAADIGSISPSGFKGQAAVDQVQQVMRALVVVYEMLPRDPGFIVPGIRGIYDPFTLAQVHGATAPPSGLPVFTANPIVPEVGPFSGRRGALSGPRSWLFRASAGADQGRRCVVKIYFDERGAESASIARAAAMGVPCVPAVLCACPIAVDGQLRGEVVVLDDAGITLADAVSRAPFGGAAEIVDAVSGHIHAIMRAGTGDDAGFMLHRNLTPQNMMVCSERHPVLLGWRSALVADSPARSRSASTQGRIGTRPFMGIRVLWGRTHRSIMDDLESVFLAVAYSVWNKYSEDKAPLDAMWAGTMEIDDMIKRRVEWLGSETEFLEGMCLGRCPEGLLVLVRWFYGLVASGGVMATLAKRAIDPRLATFSADDWVDALQAAMSSGADELADVVSGACRGQGSAAGLYAPGAWRAAIRRQLAGAAVSKGQAVSVRIGSRRIGLVVADLEAAPVGASGDIDAGVVCADTAIELQQRQTGDGPLPAAAGYEAEASALACEIQGYFANRGLYQQLKMQPPQAVCLHGVSGVGKSTIVRRALAGLPYTVVRGDLGEIVASASGTDIADEYVAMALADLAARARAAAPSVIVLDGLDVLGDEEQAGEIAAAPRLFAEFAGSIPRGVFLVLEAQSDGAGLPSSVRGCAALHHKLPVPIPRLWQREAIVRSAVRELLSADSGPGTEDADGSAALIWRVANATSGYVARDIAALCRQAFLRRLRCSAEAADPAGDLARGMAQLSLAGSGDAPGAPRLPEWEHFGAALQIVRPSQQLEFESARPTARWSDIGGYAGVKQALRQFMQLATSENAPRLGIRPPRGVLLHGPPGCGKTAMALAMIGESACNVINVRGSELFSKYLGETEARLRRLFRAARAAAPCIVFMDEVDSIAARREWASVETGSPALRVLSTLLNEMDGVHEASGVVAVGCTNQLDKIDDAILRPGRFDRIVEIRLPLVDDRRGILEVLARRSPLADDVCIDALARMTDGYSAAGLERLFREAGLGAMRGGRDALGMGDFERAFAGMQRDTLAAGQGAGGSGGRL